jgi:hypothetical protein
MKHLIFGIKIEFLFMKARIVLACYTLVIRLFHYLERLDCFLTGDAPTVWGFFCMDVVDSCMDKRLNYLMKDYEDLYKMIDDYDRVNDFKDY